MTSNVGSLSNEDFDRQELRAIMEQWIQRECIEIHNLQVDRKENPKRNEIPERQTLVKGVSKD